MVFRVLRHSSFGTLFDGLVFAVGVQEENQVTGETGMNESRVGLERWVHSKPLTVPAALSGTLKN